MAAGQPLTAGLASLATDNAKSSTQDEYVLAAQQGTPDVNGPTTTGLAVTPALANVPPLVTATMNEPVAGNSAAATEYFIDAMGANGSGSALSGAFPAATVGVRGTLSAALFNSLGGGNAQITQALAAGSYFIKVAAPPQTPASQGEYVLYAASGLPAPTATFLPLTTHNPQPALGGTVSDPAAAVQVTINGTVFAAVNNGDGTWSLAAGAIQPPLPDGCYDVTVAALVPGHLIGSVTVAGGLAVDQFGPTVTAAGAAPSPATGTTAVLSVSAADPAMGEGSLVYDWTATTWPSGAAAPTFSVNGGNAAKNTTASFNLAGDYGFTVSVTDPLGMTATGNVNVTVNPTLTQLTIAGQPPVETALDQFGNPLAAPPPGALSGTIASPLVLDNNLTLSLAAGLNLKISGSITGAGKLTLDQPGTVILTGANAYSGGTVVAAGTLIVPTPAAIPADTCLVIGAGGNLVFDPKSPAAASAASAASALPASSPDPQASGLAAAPAVLPAPEAGLVRQISNLFPHAMGIVNPSFPAAVVRKDVSCRASPQSGAGAAGIPVGPAGWAASQVLGPRVAAPVAEIVPWLQQAASGADTSSQRHRKDSAIVVLDVAFARYK